VNGLRGEDLQGSIALWGYPGEEAYFSNLKFVPAKAEAVTNGGEASGISGQTGLVLYGNGKPFLIVVSVR
jgi:hypothetical protein